jgi:carbohydrate-selective porin OprB
VDQGVEESHRGWGISLDQQITENATLFARYGHSTKGSLKFDRAFTIGGQLGGAGWGRENDRLGLAVGWLKSSNEFRTFRPTLDLDGDTVADGVQASGSEKTAELFYVWQFNENFHLSPSVQWIGRPNADPAADNISVLGLRAKVSY